MSLDCSAKKGDKPYLRINKNNLSFSEAFGRFEDALRTRKTSKSSKKRINLQNFKKQKIFKTERCNSKSKPRNSSKKKRRIMNRSKLGQSCDSVDVLDTSKISKISKNSKKKQKKSKIKAIRSNSRYKNTSNSKKPKPKFPSNHPESNPQKPVPSSPPTNLSFLKLKNLYSYLCDKVNDSSLEHNQKMQKINNELPQFTKILKKQLSCLTQDQKFTDTVSQILDFFTQYSKINVDSFIYTRTLMTEGLKHLEKFIEGNKDDIQEMVPSFFTKQDRLTIVDAVAMVTNFSNSMILKVRNLEERLQRLENRELTEQSVLSTQKNRAFQGNPSLYDDNMTNALSEAVLASSKTHLLVKNPMCEEEPDQVKGLEGVQNKFIEKIDITEGFTGRLLGSQYDSGLKESEYNSGQIRGINFEGMNGSLAGLANLGGVSGVPRGNSYLDLLIEGRLGEDDVEGIQGKDCPVKKWKREQLIEQLRLNLEEGGQDDCEEDGVRVEGMDSRTVGSRLSNSRDSMSGSWRDEIEIG